MNPQAETVTETTTDIKTGKGVFTSTPMILDGKEIWNGRGRHSKPLKELMTTTGQVPVKNEAGEWVMVDPTTDKHHELLASAKKFVAAYADKQVAKAQAKAAAEAAKAEAKAAAEAAKAEAKAAAEAAKVKPAVEAASQA